MGARSIRRGLKNGLSRMPAPFRDRVSGSLLRVYESYLAARQSVNEGESVDDGLPVPPPKLRVKVVGHANQAVFLQGGRRDNQIIREALIRTGTNVESLDCILDWGCGCGRILRWWHQLPSTDIRGCDYNPELVQWVEENLPFVTAHTNQLFPPLPYKAESFDFVYAISVLTHLTDELAEAWMRDIHRVLAPGGKFFFTTHGLSYRDRLSSAERAQFDRGSSVVQFASIEGSNLCGAYHPCEWVESQLLDGFELVEVRQAHALTEVERLELAQDRWLVRRRS